MLPTLNDLANNTVNDNLTKAIRKKYYVKEGCVGVMLRKNVDEVEGLVAWRLYRCQPKDGVTKFGRKTENFKQYYLAGGYALSYSDAEKFMDRAVENDENAWDDD